MVKFEEAKLQTVETYSLRDFEDAVAYANDANENDLEIRNNHSEHLANIMKAIWDSHRIAQD